MKIYNTLSKKVEEFKPRAGRKANMFVCGPTVYDFSHIGHAKTYTQLDTLARVLRFAGYDVFYLQNITDIDDKIIARANEKNVGWQKLGEQYKSEYMQDMKFLNNVSVNQYAKATDHVSDIIRQVQTLLDKGFAYQTSDGIYFEIAKFSDYGKLSGRREVKENDAETRIDQSDQKRGWNDFCLWKYSKPGEPVWDAPFGKGRSGWHIEDTAITEHYFGPQYDIHGGAVDLIFPHHEAEITQMESASGKSPLVNYWVHTGFLNVNSQKMSKSLGNFFTIREVIEKGYDPMAIRLFMLQSHYRSEINFSWKNLDAAQNRLNNLRNLTSLRFQINPDYKPDWAQGHQILASKERFVDALGNDLNTPAALSELNDLETQTERGINNDGKPEFVNYLQIADQCLGLGLMQTQDITGQQKQIINQRETARKNNDYKKSDELRGQLKEQGIEVRDTPSGPIWSRL